MDQSSPTPPRDGREDAGDGGGSAPPDLSERNRAPAGLTREYESPEIRVQWFADRCIHSAECIRSLPQVFDPERRPWVDIDAAGADAIAEAVLRCPTGALHFVRQDGGPQEQPPPELTIRAVEDGPYYVRGRVAVRDEAGRVLREDTRMALCRCGESRHMPLCDNTHRAIRFRDTPRAPPA